MITNVKLSELNINTTTDFLNTQIFKMILQNKNIYVVTKIFNKSKEQLKERFFNAQIFSNRDNSQFILFLQKGVYPYEYMDNREKCS